MSLSPDYVHSAVFLVSTPQEMFTQNWRNGSFILTVRAATVMGGVHALFVTQPSQLGHDFNWWSVASRIEKNDRITE